MKVYSIGRDTGCDIVINDRTDVISRRHAILNVASSGKMTIVDQSYNGTYVNGIRISPNVPFPVTRKDSVSFAHIAKLDWNLIPNSNAMIMRYSMIGAIAVAAVVGIVFGVNSLSGGGSENEVKVPIAVNDTNPDKSSDKIKKEKEVEDSKGDKRKQGLEDEQKKYSERGITSTTSTTSTSTTSTPSSNNERKDTIKPKKTFR